MPTGSSDFVQAVAGGAVYDVAADIGEQFLSKVGLNVDVDLAAIIGAYFIYKKYPNWREVAKGVAAAAASRSISIAQAAAKAEKPAQDQPARARPPDRLLARTHAARIMPFRPPVVLLRPWGRLPPRAFRRMRRLQIQM